MPSAVITSKGQITLPRAIRQLLGLATGDRVAFRVAKNGSVFLEPDLEDVRALCGMIKPRTRGISIEAMNESIAKAASGK